MTHHDELLTKLRTARPADAPTAVDPDRVLARALATPPGPRRRPPRRPAWISQLVPAAGVLVAAGVVALALVGLGHRHPAAPGRHPGAGLHLTATQYTFALSAAGAQTQDGQTLYRAEQILRARCMTQRGFHYPIAPLSTAPKLGLPSVTGIPTTFYPTPLRNGYPAAKLLALRERYGFGLQTLTSHSDPDLVDRYLNTLPKARQKRWLRAFRGRGRGGCYALARTELYGSPPAADIASLLPSRIYNELNSAVYDSRGAIRRSDHAAISAVRRWSACMRTATGRTFTTESALLDQVTRRPAPPAATQKVEAVADARCAYSSGQAQLFATRFAAAINHLPPSLTAQLRSMLAQRPAWVARAKRIIARRQITRTAS
jgi:hypothetical protein